MAYFCFQITDQIHDLYRQPHTSLAAEPKKNNTEKYLK